MPVCEALIDRGGRLEVCARPTQYLVDEPVTRQMVRVCSRDHAPYPHKIVVRVGKSVEVSRVVRGAALSKEPAHAVDGVAEKAGQAP
jgi:hypothetical protein